MKIESFSCESFRVNRPSSRCESPGHLSFSFAEPFKILVQIIGSCSVSLRSFVGDVVVRGGLGELGQNPSPHE